MKSCTYCGKENEDAATLCVECGNDSFKTATAATTAPPGVPTSTSELRLRDILADPAKLFRALVIVEISAYILSVLAYYVEPYLLSNDTMELLNNNGHGALFTMPTGIYWLTVMINSAIAIGLYHFSATARAVWAIFTVAFGVMNLISGVAIISPLSGFLAVVVAMADGAILLLAYATPLKHRFV